MADRRTPAVSRRGLLASGVAALGGAGLGIAGTRLADGEANAPPARPRMQPFHGRRQAGVSTPPQAFAAFVAFDLRPSVDRDALRRLMTIWTDDASRLTRGRPGLADTEPELAADPANLTVTVGYGPGVFTAAGLEDRRPRWLRPLPAFRVDRLVDAWSHGDLVLQVCADDELTVAHAVRLLVKEARAFATVRWRQSGFRGGGPGTSMRNLMGQVDGTHNLAAGDDALVWADGTGWLTDGTSMVVRRIAMDLDAWDELDRGGREQAVGRRLADGAPLTGRHEHDEPDLDATDDLGLPVIAPFAHIRRARSGDDAQRFLRRPYNYDDPPAPGELSNSGLVFVAFQADVDRQFVPIQRRLADLDLLNEWTTPIGSAVFAVPPGCAEGSYLGAPLLD